VYEDASCPLTDSPKSVYSDGNCFNVNGTFVGVSWASNFTCSLGLIDLGSSAGTVRTWMWNVLELGQKMKDLIMG